MLLALNWSTPTPAQSTRIYGLFACATYTGECVLEDDSVYATLAQCQAEVRMLTQREPDQAGRTAFGPQLWFECRGRRVDVWEVER
jgi:hypothetical protein